MDINIYDQGEQHYCIPSFADGYYKEVENPNNWLQCPNCKLKPVVNIRDHMCYTSCGCDDSNKPNIFEKYNGFHVKAESICSIYNREDSTMEEKETSSEERLMNNWNHWVETGELLFTKEKYPDRW